MKPYYQLTPAERLALRIAQNKEIEARVAAKMSAKAPAKVSKAGAAMDRAITKEVKKLYKSTSEFDKALADTLLGLLGKRVSRKSASRKLAGK